MTLKLPKIIPELLQKYSDEKFSSYELTERIFKDYPKQCEEKRKKSTAIKVLLTNDKTLIQQIVSEIPKFRSSLQEKYPQIKTIEGRPRKYYYTEKTDIEEFEQVQICNNSISSLQKQLLPKEKDLYSKLSEYLDSENIYSHRINEERSTNERGPNGNKWLYPDIVGAEDLSAAWRDEIKDCVKEYFDKKTKLSSYEVKTLINQSNIRQVFFQTVSNSSWANLGYLVITGIQGNNTKKELDILCNLHGIGVIELNVNEPLESYVMIPAKEKQKVDWNTANRLATENIDFRNFIKYVRHFYKTGDSEHLKPNTKSE
ncbi:MAG TPA: hypothetical protein LFV90_04430 [Rickettsia endosymbiont of Columbicola hoogstraali]|nr:hypothetical protein [Rickettsia endosymbiont of Columbicola hoogstraali]